MHVEEWDNPRRDILLVWWGQKFVVLFEVLFLAINI